MSAERRDAHLIQYWNILVKRRRVVFAFAAVLVVTVLVGSLLSTRYYASTTVLEIAPKAPVYFPAGDVSESAPAYPNATSLKAYYTTQYRIIESRKVREEAVRRLREEKGVDDFDGVPDPPARLKKFMTVEAEPETELVRITVEYPDADKAALFANTLAQSYLDVKREQALDETKKAMKWLEEQLEEYRTRTVSSDKQLRKYQFEHQLVGTDEGKQLPFTSREQLQTAWSDAHTRHVKLQAVYDGLRAVQKKNGLLPLATLLSADDTVLQGLLARHQELLEDRSKLLGRLTPQHPDVVRLDKEIASLKSQIGDQVQTIMSAKKGELSVVIGEEKAISDALQKTEGDIAALQEPLIQVDLLKTEATRNEQFYRDLDTRLSEVGISQFIAASNVHQIETAIAGRKPVRPRTLVNVLTALLLGLIGGAALAMVVEYFDFTVRTRQDIEELLGIPFLGLVPRVDPEQLEALAHSADRMLPVAALPRSGLAESLRTIRTHISFRMQRQPHAKILVTSTLPREGKSFIASNLSAIFAMGKSRVLLIDGDLRRPSLDKTLHVDNRRGLKNVLADECRAAEVIQPTNVPGLDVLPAGHGEGVAGEMIDMDRMAEILASMQDYDMVVIDSPPVNVVSDASVFASLVDGIVFVVESASTGRAPAQQCIEQLRTVNPAILGGVVNKFDVHRASYGYYYTYPDYSYGEPEAEAPTRKRGA